MAGETSWIYAVTEDGKKHKIGHSCDIRRRMATFQTGHANQLRLTSAFAVPRAKARAMEAYIHKDLGHRRIRREIFSISEEEVRRFFSWAEIRLVEDPLIGGPVPPDWSPPSITRDGRIVEA